MEGMLRKRCPPGYRITAIPNKDYVWLFKLTHGAKTLDYFRTRIGAIDWAWICYKRKRE